MDGTQANPHSDLLQNLFDQCPAYSFPAPWAFLPVDNLCRSALTDPCGSLQSLLGQYSLDVLKSANVVEQTDYQGWLLRSELCNPVGGLIGLRGNDTHPINGVITARGSLPKRLDPWALAAQDLTIGEAIDEWALLFVTFSFGDTALLRALGMPAVIGLGLKTLGLSSLKAMNDLQGSEDYGPDLSADNKPAATNGKVATSASPAPSTAATPNVTAANPEDEIPPAADDPRKIGLVLVGWSPYRLNFPYGSQLRMVANHFSKLRRYMGMTFPAISVWQISPDAIENLRFRLNWQDREIITEFFSDSMHNLHDLERFAAPDVSLTLPKASAFTDLISAQDSYLHELTNDRSPGKKSHRIQAAQALYQQMLQSALILPLQEWALSHDDPVVRPVGMELADVCRMLHQMRPCLLALGHNGIERKGPRLLRKPTDIDDGLDMYLKLCKQFDSLVRALCLLRDS